ncbi:hypothetical protein CAAN1_01S13872 [[Candida] anglica]|uniref:Uncharacterized protein n=1 Tax=[Candida] anglica TaxID=148631 RepID=A0ABP0EPM4_9ASCO
MSFLTKERIPRHIRKLLSIYQDVSRQNSHISSAKVESFLKKDTSYHENFVRSKLSSTSTTTGMKYNVADFTPAALSHVKPIFAGDLTLHELESVPIDQIIDHSIKLHDLPLAKSSNFYQGNTKHKADMVSALAAHFSPKSFTSNHNSSGRWYQELLDRTPIIFILAQKHRLFSEDSIAQINVPLNKFSNQLKEIKQKVIESQSGRRRIVPRSYHLTEMRQMDTFKAYLGGSEYNPLCESIDRASEIVVTDSNFTPVVEDSEQIELKLVEFVQGIKETRVSYKIDRIPYDLKYTTFHMLTIESGVKNCQHTELLDLLESSQDEFEIVGVRLSLNSGWIRQFFNSKNQQQESHKGTYQEMLDKTKLQDDKPSNVEEIMTRLGEMGHIHVHKGNNCIYLLKDD